MSLEGFTITPEIYAYIDSVASRESQALQQLRERTAQLPQAQMMSSPLVAQFLSLLVELTQARRIIEVGTFTGYGALAMAEKLPPDGQVFCCDVSDEYAGLASDAWAQAGCAEQITLTIAPAKATLNQWQTNPDFVGKVDLAFVDADKVAYPAYYELLLPLLRPRGIIVFDNTLQRGAVAHSEQQTQRVQAIDAFNRFLQSDERVAYSLLPVSDGLSLVVKR